MIPYLNKRERDRETDMVIHAFNPTIPVVAAGRSL